MTDPTTRDEEHLLREKLGIPPSARHVLVFGESSHWDPNWLYTSEQYYHQRIRHVLDTVLCELEKEPRRVFSIESIFFLRRYWELEPGRRDAIRALVEQGRLRFTGSGITTPDTNLPNAEAILRDYLLGQLWLSEQGLHTEPRVAYLPDDFGASPATPGLLRAAGFDMTAVTRIDGMHFIGCDYRPSSSYPFEGSSAELLLRELKTTDFIWRGPDGSEVLCHWNAFNYFQGDMLACKGIVRWMGRTIGLRWRTRNHLAGRIEGYARDLGPLARTPYMFCPIGCDFNEPICDLVALLDGYNRHRFPDGGIWAVNAGLDDYLRLVNCHRDRLPTVSLDPNPYWMGFYATRPEAKIRHNRILRKLTLIEKLSAFCSQPERLDGLKEAWELLAVSNHHDFITGTSPDRVWEQEQRPCLLRSEQLTDCVLAQVQEECPRPPSGGRCRPPAWRLAHGRLEVHCRHYQVVMTEQAGGCMISFKHSPDSDELLAGPANDLVAYHDSGGLWRFGHEFCGGRFRARSRASDSFARIQAEEQHGLLEVRVDSDLEHQPFVRWLWFRDDSPAVRMRVSGSAGRRLTIACRFPTRLRVQQLDMDVSGGFINRPARRIYDPTYWAANSFVHVRDTESGLGLAAMLGGPACVGLVQPGVLEWVVLRNVPREMAFGLLPIMAHPASGTDPDEHSIEYAIWHTPEGDWREHRLPILARSVLGPGWLSPGKPDLDTLADSNFSVDRNDVLVAAIKAADFGEGLVVRLLYFGETETQVRLCCGAATIRLARLCDARERDLRDLTVDEGVVVVPLTGAITSLRVLVHSP